MKKIALMIFSVVLITSLSGCGVQPKEDNEYVTSTVGVGAPVLPQNQDACIKACTNYENKCIVLVPNADSALLQDAMDSCMEACATWDNEKIQCMADAEACEDMTNVCGL